MQRDVQEVLLLLALNAEIERESGGCVVFLSGACIVSGVLTGDEQRCSEDVRRQLFYYLYNSAAKAGAKILIQYTQLHSVSDAQRCKISTEFSFKVLQQTQIDSKFLL